MLHQHKDQLRDTPPTYHAEGLSLTVRINGKPVPQVAGPTLDVDVERRARCLAWREGCVIQLGNPGLIVMRAHSGRKVLWGLFRWEEVIEAAESGELAKAVRRG